MDNNLNAKGSALKQARESRGITLEVAHENTKIPLDALRALEEGYSIRTMTPFYQKGFLKMYAQYLQLDVNETLRSYNYQLLNNPKASVAYPPPLGENYNKQRVNGKYKETEPRKVAVVEVKEPETVPVVPIISRAQNKIATPKKLNEESKEKKELKEPPKEPPRESQELKEPKPPKEVPAPLPQLFEEAPKPKPQPPREKISVRKAENILSAEQMETAGKIIGTLLVLLIVVKVFGWIGHKNSVHKTKPPISKTIHAKPQTAKKIREIKEVRQVKAPPVQPKVEPVPEKVVEAAPVPVTPIVPVAEPVQEPQPAPMVVQSVDPSMKKNVDLTVRAKKNSWLMVKSDGVTVFQSVLKKGVTESWTADNEIELSGKNISQLEFEVNGKMLGALSRKDMGAKIVVINKNGLSVKK